MLYGGDTGVTEHVRIRKIATRSGRPEMLDDGHVVEGDDPKLVHQQLAARNAM